MKKYVAQFTIIVFVSVTLLFFNNMSWFGNINSGHFFRLLQMPAVKQLSVEVANYNQNPTLIPLQIDTSVIVPGTHNSCGLAGTKYDSRPKDRQYFCDEIPFGSTTNGASPAREEELKKFVQSSCPAGFQIHLGRSAIVDQCRGAMGDIYQGVGVWKTSKVAFRTVLPLKDYAGKNRDMHLIIDAYRKSIVENVSIRTNMAQALNTSISQPLGQYYVAAKVDAQSKTAYMELCGYFPGVKFQGRPIGTNFTVAEGKDWFGGRWYLDGRVDIDPGSFQYKSTGLCGLIKINPYATSPNQAVQLIALTQPRFEGAQFNGFKINVSSRLGFNIVDSIVTNLLQGISFFYLGGRTLDSALSGEGQNQLNQAGRRLANGNYISVQQFQDILKRVNQSPAVLNTGRYIQDLATQNVIGNMALPGILQSLKTLRQPEVLKQIQNSAQQALNRSN